jgi:hypothetical protein
MEAVLAQSQAEKEAVQARLHEGIDELATLTKLLAASESLERQSSDEAEWLRETGSILVNGSTTLKGRLLSMMPAAFQQKRYRRLLKGKGLFDGEAYLAAHPDVAADGVDPLGHYLKHGMAERRRRA